jgi:YhcH/YjgK/YiaL family protein
MIIAPLLVANRYANLHPLFDAAFAFLRRAESLALPDGRHPIDGEFLHAVVSRRPARPPENAVLEAHRNHIDIHYIIAGADTIGWRSFEDCRAISREYDPADDVELFHDRPVSWTLILPGSFVVLFPEDAHAPMASPDGLHKIVVKVRITAP